MNTEVFNVETATKEDIIDEINIEKSFFIQSAKNHYLENYEDETSHNKKIYAAKNRIDFMINFDVLDQTYFNEINYSDLSKKKLIEIYQTINNLTYKDFLKNHWYCRLKEVYKNQVTTRKERENNSNVCALVLINNKFVTMSKTDKITLSTKKALATEFNLLTTTNKDKETKRISKVINTFIQQNKQEFEVEKMKVIYTKKDLARNVYEGDFLYK